MIYLLLTSSAITNAEIAKSTSKADAFGVAFGTAVVGFGVDTIVVGVAVGTPVTTI